MSKMPVLLTLALSILSFSGCAAKNRLFSRKDYDAVQDPFMESDAIASADSNKSDQNSPPRSRLSALISRSREKQPDDADGVARPEPTPNSAVSGKASLSPSTSTGTTSVLRSYQGTALSSFLNRKDAPPEAPNGLAEAPSGATAVAPQKTAENPAKVVAKTAPASPEVEAFSNFIQASNLQSAAEPPVTETASTGTVTATPEDFGNAVLPSQQKPPQADSVAVKKNVDGRTAIDNMDSNTLFGGIAESPEHGSMDPEDEASATPLMRKYAKTEPDWDAEFAEVEKPTNDGNANPFDSPFEALNEQKPGPVNPASIKPVLPIAAKTVAPPSAFASGGTVQSDVRKSGTTKPTTAPRALDDSFQIDSGWKPAQLIRP